MIGGWDEPANFSAYFGSGFRWRSHEVELRHVDDMKQLEIARRVSCDRWQERAGNENEGMIGSNKIDNGAELVDGRDIVLPIITQEAECRKGVVCGNRSREQEASGDLATAKATERRFAA